MRLCWIELSDHLLSIIPPHALRRGSNPGNEGRQGSLKREDRRHSLVFMNESDMSVNFIGARELSNDVRRDLAIESLSESKTITQLAEREGVSRKFLHRQKNVAIEALNEAFATKADSSVLFNLPVTKSWLNQVVLGLALICHSSYRGVTEFLRDVVGVSVSLGTVHNLIHQAARQAAPINRS